MCVVVSDFTQAPELRSFTYLESSTSGAATMMLHRAPRITCVFNSVSITSTCKAAVVGHTPRTDFIRGLGFAQRPQNKKKEKKDGSDHTGGDWCCVCVCVSSLHA